VKSRAGTNQRTGGRAGNRRKLAASTEIWPKGSALKVNRRLTIGRKLDEAADGGTRGRIAQQTEAWRKRRKPEVSSRCLSGEQGIRRKLEARQTGITGKVGARRKPRAGRTGLSREDRFQVNWELITGEAGRFGARRKPGVGRPVLTGGLRTRWILEIGCRRRKPKDARAG